MAVRSNIVGIDSPEALEKALRAAYYLADEGLATSAYLGLALGVAAAGRRLAVFGEGLYSQFHEAEPHHGDWQYVLHQLEIGRAHV